MMGYEKNFDLALAMLAPLSRWPVKHQRFAVGLYRQLARGGPVRRESLAQPLGIAAGEALSILEHEHLKGLVSYDGAGRITGFRGLALDPTPHRIDVDGHSLFGWCAMDTLFMAEVLGRRIRVESPCPQTGRVVRLTLVPGAVEAVEPSDTVVSFVSCDASVLETEVAKVISSFCHHIFFLASPEAGHAWTARHPGTFLLPLEQALEWGRRFNAGQLGDALAAETMSV